MKTFGQPQHLKGIKKLYITCLQFSYSLPLLFPYDIIYLPDGCEANATTFILPYNKCLNVDSDIKTSENKFSFNRPNSKIENFNLMQALNISNFCNTTLLAIVDKIPEMKDSSIVSINSTLIKLRSFPKNYGQPTYFT